MAKIKYDADQVESVFAAHKDEDAIVITSDGNVFLEKHESYAKSHCREFKQTYERLTRTEFEAGEKGGKSKTLAASVSGDWKVGKFGDIAAFAKSKGLEVKTKQNKGTAALIIEVEAYLATLDPKEELTEDTNPDADKSGGDDSADDYTPVGSGTDSNLKA